MPNAETEAMITKIVDHAREGYEIYPMFFQPVRGRSNTVSAAIRVAKSRGLIEQCGVDGVGKPMYKAVWQPATHTVSQTVN